MAAKSKNTTLTIIPVMHYRDASGAIEWPSREDQDYGGRGYSYRDPEGHVWNFGTYDPWAERS